MRGQIQRLRALRQREAVADQPFQIHLAIHHKANRFFLQVHRCAVGADQSFLIDTNGCRINHGLSVLRLRKQQNPPTGTGRIHRSANQRVSADSQNDCIGATPFGQFADTLNYVCL